jgi:hypothetical protein
MSKKISAVEWLVEQMTQQDFIAIPKPEWIEQAKEMEKEQIENAFNYGQIDLGMEADEYYNQTFKSE